MRALLEKLQDLYGRGDDEEAAPFRLTDRGIWHPTPLAVLAAAVPLIVEANLLEARGGTAQVLDAGAGDGRLLAALALGLDATVSVRLGGLESDASLAATARERLDTMARWGVVPHRVSRVAEGDFFDPRAYELVGLVPRQLDVVFNYPDSNERRLLQWLAEQGGPQTRLAILSPDHDPALGEAPEWRAPVRAEGDLAALWTLTVFAPASACRW